MAKNTAKRLASQNIERAPIIGSGLIEVAEIMAAALLRGKEVRVHSQERDEVTIRHRVQTERQSKSFVCEAFDD